MSEPEENTEQGDMTAFFQTALNRHGYSFQYAVIRRANELSDQKRSGWSFVFSEFPVEVQGGHTRIDFVLSQFYHGGIGPCRLLIAECKRADPALSNWLFAPAPYVNRSSAPNSILMDCVKREYGILATSLGRKFISENIYHIAVEVKGKETGDSTGTGRRTIEDAATQVIRGLNGLIECFSKNPRYLANDVQVEFIPVIFTTAKIWATETDISGADLANGKVALTSDSVTRKPWLWLQYHVSPGLKHTVDRHEQTHDDLRDIDLEQTDLSDLLEIEYARTIAVVGPDGIDSFLTSQH